MGIQRDLKIYVEAFGANLFHYQDYNQKEIDAVILGFSNAAYCRKDDVFVVPITALRE